MSWLWFIDESGHDHKNTPLEVRGGVAIHSSKIWDFVIDFNKSYAGKCGKIQYSGDVVKGQKKYKSHGIIFVPDPYNEQASSKTITF